MWRGALDLPKRLAKPETFASPDAVAGPRMAMANSAVWQPPNSFFSWDEMDAPQPARQDEFLRLFSQHSRRVFEFISTLVFNSSDADEVFQNTCVVLWRKFANYDSEGSFYAWACKIAYLEVLHLRRSSKRLQVLSEEVLTLLADDLLSRSAQIPGRQGALQECLEKLEGDDRELVQQRYYLQRRPKEIAARHAASVHSIYRSLARVHTTLRECVGRVMARENVS